MLLLQRKTVCPNCKGARCRESRWFSSDEKEKHPQHSPYRCIDCSHRFLSFKHSSFSEKLISAPIALVILILAITATYLLARIETGSPRVAPVAATALDPKILQAAKAGDAGAQFTLAEALLRDPARTTENSVKAVRWLEKSAENGNTEAMIVLARLSRTGVGTLQDFCNMVHWTHMAAARGDAEGMLELGRLYRDGLGVNKDLARAYVWFNRSAAAHNLDSVRERENIARTLTHSDLIEAQRQSSAPDSVNDRPSEMSACKG